MENKSSLRAVKHLRRVSDKSLKEVLNATEGLDEHQDQTLQKFKQESLEAGRQSLSVVKRAIRQQKARTLRDFSDQNSEEARSSRAKTEAHKLSQKSENSGQKVFGTNTSGAEQKSSDQGSFLSSGSKRAVGASRRGNDAAGTKRARIVSANKLNAAQQKKLANEKSLVKRRVARKEAIKGTRRAAKTGREAGRAASAAASTNTGRIFIIILAGIILLVLALMMISTASVAGGASSNAMAQSGLADINLALIEDFKTRIGAEWSLALRETREGLVASGIENQNIVVRYNAAAAEDEGDNEGVYRLDNWNDVFAIWLLLNDKVMDESDYDAVKDIFYKMNPIATSSEEVEDVPDVTDPVTEGETANPEATAAKDPAAESDIDPETGEAIEVIPLPVMKTVGYIDVTNYRFAEAKDLFSLTDEQIAEAESWFTDDFNRSLWAELLGLGVSQGDDYSGMYVNIPAGSELTTVFDEAVKMNGWQYSRSMRMKTGYADCSSFVWRCFHAAGIDIGSGTYAPTAAEQARWCDEHNLRVRSGDEQTGDIIFWADARRNNNRYLNIYHVAIYAGDGYMWESCPSANGVIYRKVSVQRPKNILFYARPSAA